MITGFIINSFYILIYNLINFLPNGNGIPNNWINAIHNIWTYVDNFSFIFPITDIISVLITAISFEVGILLVKLVLWTIKTVRGSG